MTKPNNIIDLKELMSNMEHRERFCFKVSDDIKLSGELEMLEIYHTYIWGSVGMDSNITITLTDVSGKLVNKKNKISRLLRLADEKFCNMIFNYIV